MKKNVIVHSADVKESTLRAYMSEYPWLSKILFGFVVKGLHTSRADEVIEGQFVYPHRVFILDGIGTCLTEVGKVYHKAAKSTWNNWFPKPYVTDILGEKIWEAILRVKPDNILKSDPYFIVTYSNGYVTIYKPPKNRSSKLLELAQSFNKPDGEYLTELAKIQSV